MSEQKTITPEQLLSRFNLPAQDLTALSFSSTNRPSSVKAWAGAIPATRITHTGVVLYKALPELSRLQTSPENRLEMLEAVRPYVHHCILGLSKGFLNQPLILPEGPLKTAVVAQALQKYMVAGYELVIRELFAKTKAGKAPDTNLELACHRALSGLGLLLLRGYQLYRQIPNNIWLEVHSIYLLAEHLNFVDKPIHDDLLLKYGSASTISQNYLRILLLACARPNQLRQLEVSATYDVLEDWARFTKLVPVDYNQQNNLFVINLGADMAPLYKSRFSGTPTLELRELDLGQLITALKKQREQKDDGKKLVDIPNAVTNALLDHLEQAWSVAKQRAFERQPSNATIDVCVGISNLHHQVINGSSFDEFLGLEDIEEIDFGAFSTDAWINAGSDKDDEDDHSVFSIQVVDTSPGGYCLEWRTGIPAQVRAGEAIGLREKGRHRWGLGVIRWVQQQTNVTRLGIQILSPKTTPFGAALEQAGGYGDYLRVLMVPELKVANQPATLVTAHAPFQEFSRLQLNSHGEISEAQLTRRIFSTGAVSQFTFRILSTQPSKTADSQNTASQNSTTTAENGAQSDSDDYNSVWDD